MPKAERVTVDTTRVMTDSQMRPQMDAVAALRGNDGIA